MPAEGSPTPDLRRIAAAAALVLLGGSMSPGVSAQTLAPPVPQDSSGGISPQGLPAGTVPTAPSTASDDPDAGPDLRPTDSGSPGTPNYGKPRPRQDTRLAYPGRRKAPPHALPPLVPTMAPSVVRSQRAVPQDQSIQPEQPPPTIAAVPQIVRKPPPKTETSPYAPVGIPLGDLRLVPYIEGDAGYSSNPNQLPTGAKGSSTLRAETRFAMTSDWTRHALTGELHAGYTDFLKDSSASRPDANGKVDLRLDVLRDLTADLELRGTLDTQRPTSPNVNAPSIKSRPIIATFGTTAGATQMFGNFGLGLHGTIDRTVNQNATLPDGTVIDLATGNYTAYGVQSRFSYQLTPQVIPFAEAIIDTRKHDQAIDTLGFARDSNGLAARFGSTFELTRLLTGQVAAGYARRDYVDPRLPVLAAPTFDASLIWTPTPLTTVTLKSTTTLSETNVANASGSVTRTTSAEIDHALLRNLTLGAIGSFGTNDYQGASIRETTLSGTLKAEYNLSRSVVVKGSFTHERLQSTTPGSDYTASTFLLGLRLQR